MLTHPQIDPVALRIPFDGQPLQLPFSLPLIGDTFGPLAIHWYGVMYGLAFIIGYFVVKALARRRAMGLSDSDVMDFVTYIVLGVVLGGRLGYILFYGLSSYLQNPAEILAVWKGGMSFHGGAIGSVLAGWLYCRKRGLSFWQMADITVVTVPIGLGLGRLGNFINAELWGRQTDLPWAMVFPTTDPLQLPRHPSQLYELGLEGFVLFAMVWFYARRNPPTGSVFGLFLMGYGVFRFFVEFFRNPDAHLGTVLGPFSMGQLLSFPMVLVGIALMVWAYRKKTPVPAAA
jgi:phosphatidylglycerol:prolipoprotein diacylglycerol transferase